MKLGRCLTYANVSLNAMAGKLFGLYPSNRSISSRTASRSSSPR
jgi:hypothetical protein